MFFYRLAQTKFQSAAVIEAALRAAHAQGVTDQTILDPILERFVDKSLEELQDKYTELFSLFWLDDGAAADEFETYVSSYHAVPEKEPPPPSTEPGGSNGDGLDGIFERERSALWLAGYRVGKTNGLEDSERRRFLDWFFGSQLPAVVADRFGDAYGKPHSNQRLEKMANVIAANCRNFKRNDSEKYHQAIADYEVDLAYLKSRYFALRQFSWPETEI
jgi:hypothetical protein